MMWASRAALIVLIWVCCIIHCLGFLPGVFAAGATNGFTVKRQPQKIAEPFSPQCTYNTELYGLANQAIPLHNYVNEISTSKRTFLLRPLSVVAGFTGVLLASRNGMYKLKPIVAVPLVGLLGSLFNPVYAASMYAGAFGGLTSLSAFASTPRSWLFMAVSISCTHEVWERFNIFKDVGGRLGFGTATGLTCVLLIIRTLFPARLTIIALMPGWHHLVSAVSLLETSKILCGSLIVYCAAFATILVRRFSAGQFGTNRIAEDKQSLISKNSVHCSPVRASATIALLAAPVLSGVQLTYCGGAYSINCAAAVLMGTFLGMRTMSHYNNDDKLSGMLKVAAQSVLSTIVLMVLNTTPLGKIGGVLGIATVCSTLFTDQVFDVYSKVLNLIIAYR